MYGSTHYLFGKYPTGRYPVTLKYMLSIQNKLAYCMNYKILSRINVPNSKITDYRIPCNANEVNYLPKTNLWVMEVRILPNIAKYISRILSNIAECNKPS